MAGDNDGLPPDGEREGRIMSEQTETTNAGQLMADAIEATEAAALVPGWVARLNDDLGSVASRLEGYRREAAAPIVTVQDRDDAVALIQRITADGKDVQTHEILSRIINGYHQVHRQWCGVRDCLLTPLLMLKKQKSAEVVAWEKEQRRQAEAERARLQAIADAEIERQRRRLEAEAAKLKTPELREARLEAAASLVSEQVQSQAPAPAAGASTAGTWAAELVDLEALIAAASVDPSARMMLAFDPAAAKRIAIATGGRIQVPGVRFHKVETLRTRGVGR